MMSLWDALRMNMMISYQELVRTFPNIRVEGTFCFFRGGQCRGGSVPLSSSLAYHSLYSYRRL
ncbi:hypothetical protein D1619_28350 [Klebsiella pneumoniae]|nr:hypothetical protein D1619_28350 [Klebsiella pneumoniae]RIV18586.1 hypothetical protein D1623_28380 [Klebsiella pneumoniae]